MTTLRVLSAGAARGLVTALSDRFTAAAGATVDGFFSAVGVVRERFEAGEPCDVLILTARQLAELEAAGRLRPGSAVPLGAVRTAVAVPRGQPVPDIATGPAFADAVRAATAIFMPDPHRSTAGIHVRTTLERLGLYDEVAPRIRAFPNGETAMRTLAEEAPPGAVGTTQTTEILYTPGLVLVGPLPPGHDLSTVYAAAISAAAALPEPAASLVALLTGPQTMELRQRSGFE